MTSIADWNPMDQIPAMLDDLIMSDVGDDRFSNLTLDDAKALLRQLSSANNQLKVTLQQSLQSMDNTCSKLAAYKESEKQKEKERCEKARSMIQSLKQSNEQKDKIISELQHQMKQSVGGGATSVDNQNVLFEYQQKALVCQQQVIQLEEQLRASEQQKTAMHESLQKAHGDRVLQLQLLEKKLENSSSVIDNLRTHLADTQAELKAEKDKSLAQHNELTQLSFRYEQLMAEYTKILNANKQQSYKDTELSGLKKDYEQRIDNLTAQLIMGEEALQVRDNQIQALKQQSNELMNQIKQKEQEIEVWKCQTSVFQSDFEAERKSREELNDKRLALIEENDQLRAHLATAPRTFGNTSGLQAASRTVVAEETGPVDINRGAVGGVGVGFPRFGQDPFPNQQQQQHTPPDVNRFPHGDVNQHLHLLQAVTPLQEQVPADQNRRTFTTPPNQNPLLTPGSPINAWTLPDEEHLQDVEYRCPLCNLLAPDADSLTLHCNECIK